MKLRELGESKEMPKATTNKRKCFFATDRERSLIVNLRQFVGMNKVRDAVSNGILRELENLERKKSFLKQEGKEFTEEFQEICIALGPLELVYLNWRELMKELTGEK